MLVKQQTLDQENSHIYTNVTAIEGAAAEFVSGSHPF